MDDLEGTRKEASQYSYPTTHKNGFWRQRPRLRSLFSPVDPVDYNENPVMVNNFYRFLEGADDDSAIRGWRYVMNRRSGRVRRQIKRAGLN